jgi:hypothetical protein
MTKEGIKRWNTTLDAVFRPLERFLDKRRRKKSFERPVICGHGRDALRYYEKGCYVVVEAELNIGPNCSGRLIHRCCFLKWDDTCEQLGEAETQRVIESLCAELDRKKIRWAIIDE